VPDTSVSRAGRETFLLDRIPSIDGLRAIAIFCVLLAHASATINFPAQALKRPLGFVGVLGVELFFVISGFLIASILLREVATTGRFDMKRFWARRALRILPVFASLVLVLIVLRMFGYVSIRLRGWLELATFTVNFQYAPRWSMGHLWYLAVQVHFYVLFSLIFRHLRSGTVIRILFGTMIFGFAARWLALVLFRRDPVMMEMIQYITFTRLDSLAAGCLLAYGALDADVRRQLDRLATNRWIVGLCWAAVGAVLVLSATVWWALSGIGQTAFALVLPIILWWAIRGGGPVVRALRSPLLSGIGMTSYSIYLWQQLFLFQGRPGFVHRFPQNIVFTLVAALISYRYIERPFLLLKQRFSVVGRSDLERRKTGAPVPVGPSRSRSAHPETTAASSTR
jgi:peptidoglycan/LPS O-acetylase OafA/YrhL